VRYFLYVENKNPLSPLINSQLTNSLTRSNLPGAFVLSSVDQTVFLNGELMFTARWLPPPDNAGYGRVRSGRWPSTVTCPESPTDPCNVSSPAILPGEKTVAFIPQWVQGTDDPTGTYVFRFTVHGTLDGAPVDLTADSPPIVTTH
jgi:hypothetical protein